MLLQRRHGAPVSRIKSNGGACGMNPLLAHYGVAVHHPEVSGAEHLELLQIRDQLAGLEPLLTAEELEALGVADAILAAQAPRVQRELQRFVDLAVYRCEGFDHGAGHSLLLLY